MLFLFLLVDGSVVEAELKTAFLPFQSKYGNLSIPVSDIYHVNFGIHFAPDARRKIHAYMHDLGNVDYKVRESATMELRRFGQWTKHELIHRKEPWPNLEAAKRAKLLEQYLVDEPERAEEDHLLTAHMDAKGRMLFEKIAVKSTTIGDLEIGTHQIVTMRSAGGLEKKIRVLAGSGWQQGIPLYPGDKVRLEADGTVDLWPQDPGRYVCTPDGYVSNGIGSSFKAGRLLARLEGDIYSVGCGTGYVLRARSSCIVEFMIAPGPWEPSNILGHYDVKVRRSR